MQFWILHAIPNKDKFYKLTPPHGVEGWQTIFMYSSGHFMSFPAETFLLVNLPTTTYEEWGVVKMKFHVQIWTFHSLSIKTILMKLLLTPIPMSVGVTKLEFCGTFNLRQFLKRNSKLGPNFTCWRTHIIAGRVSFHLHFIGKVCLVILEIILGFLLQISWATICHPRHFL